MCLMFYPIKPVSIITIGAIYTYYTFTIGMSKALSKHFINTTVVIPFDPHNNAMKSILLNTFHMQGTNAQGLQTHLESPLFSTTAWIPLLLLLPLTLPFIQCINSQTDIKVVFQINISHRSPSFLPGPLSSTLYFLQCAIIRYGAQNPTCYLLFKACLWNKIKNY